MAGKVIDLEFERRKRGLPPTRISIAGDTIWGSSASTLDRERRIMNMRARAIVAGLNPDDIVAPIEGNEIVP